MLAGGGAAAGGGGGAAAGHRSLATEGFTPEQLAEVYDLFTMFDRNSDGRIGRNEFGPMMKTLGLNLTDRELNMFFDRMDDSGDGFIEFHELTEFLQHIARPISLEEELTEAFRFFGPTVGNGTTPSMDSDLDIRRAMITKKSLAKMLADKGEDITEAECGDMIAAATGGLEEIDFRTFQRFVQARVIDV
mmetsp:Transcript_120594/g.303108  ORF Transcript_120594/g.303108 Transcript_120594/m.303108 type:complete len:190 (+) Transcript_120594:3-572(+)